MNRNSNLQNALKKAFGEHTEPLNESQWDRLSSALGEKKPRKRFLPWIFALVMVAGLSIGLGYWLGNNSGSNKLMNDKIVINQANEVRSHSTNNNDLQTSESNTKQDNNDKSQNIITNDQERNLTKPPLDEESRPQLSGSTENRDRQANNNHTVKDNTNGTGNDKKHVTNDKQVVDMSLLGKPKDEKEGLSNKEEIDNRDAQVPVEPFKDQPTDNGTVVMANGYSVKEDTTIKKDPMAADGKDKDSSTGKKSGSGTDEDVFKRFAIGVSSGLSQAKYRDITMTNAGKMHTDTRDLYNESNSDVSSYFVNMFFDVRVFRNINLNISSGLQYRQLQSHENITYVYDDIPFRDIDGSIFGYFHVPDTLVPDIYRNTSTLTTRFMSLPVAFCYSLPLGVKNEIQFSAGLIFNKILSTNGNTFSVNDSPPEIIDISDKYSKKISLGYLGGLNYYRNIYGDWWLGAGVQWQQSRTQFNNAFGTIKSDINMTNYTLNLKYKF